MDCGVVSIWQMPLAEHKALQKCSWLEVPINIIAEGTRQGRTRKGGFHYERGHGSGLCYTTSCTVGKK